MNPNIIIIGGGVIGCAIAEAVSRKWQDVFLVEQLPKLGMATSTRNSGVIHSGIYYPKDSLKARHCVRGNGLTFAFCKKHGVAHRRTGILVVAADERELGELAALLARGEGNGVEGVQVIDAADIRKREPHVKGSAALLVPSTGIVSAEELVKAYARRATDQGASILTRARVVSLEPRGEVVRVGLMIGDEEDPQAEIAEARCVINAAGLFADAVAAMADNTDWKIYPVRGEYCEIQGAKAALINGLVYPLPHANTFSLGVHFTKTLWGTVLVGPSARYVQDKDNYERGRLSIAEFVESARTLLPEITESDLRLGYSGLRPKLVAPGSTSFADFVIARDKIIAQIVHLVGIESPGLTAAPSIAEQVLELVTETLG
jgi:glycerol-3-phosphate dehydrogenase